MNILEYNLRIVNGEVRLKFKAFDHPDRGKGDFGVFGGMEVQSDYYPELRSDTVLLPGDEREDDHETATYTPEGDPNEYMEKVRAALEGWRASWDPKAELKQIDAEIAGHNVEIARLLARREEITG